MKKRILIIGGSGQIGSALRNALAKHDVIAPAHSKFDVVTSDLATLLAEYSCDVLINCAAFHNVDVCEREPERAFLTNAVAVDRIAAVCAERGVAFMTFSTDYVFDGTASRPYREEDPTLPRTAYGASKLAGELLTRRHGPKHFIIRTSGVFGTTGASNKGYTLIEKVLAQAQRGETTRMVADMIFSPSYAPHIALAVYELIENDMFGTHHVTNVGACSWYEFVRTTFAKAGLEAAPLERIDYASFGNPTQRPMYSPLENTTFSHAGIPPMPAWESAIDDFLIARANRLRMAAE